MRSPVLWVDTHSICVPNIRALRQVSSFFTMWWSYVESLDVAQKIFFLFVRSDPSLVWTLSIGPLVIPEILSNLALTVW